MTLRSRAGEAGFTLIEMIVVLVVLALAMTVFVGRGPMRSRSVVAAGVAREIAEALRVARSAAIATGRPVTVSIDPARHAYGADKTDLHSLPPDIGLEVRGPDGRPLPLRTSRLDIQFRPDGSATGGSLAVADGARTLHVGVDWITGRVSLAD